MLVNKKSIDIIELLLFPLIATTIGYGLQVNFFWSIFLFFGLPSLYLSIRHPKFIKRSAFFSAIVSVPIVIMVDYIAHITHQWIVPQTIFPMRIFNEVPFEDVILAFMQFYIVIMYYQTFIDKQYSKIILPKRLSKLLVIILISMLSFLAVYLFVPARFNASYYYLKLCIVALIPVFIQLMRYPPLRQKFLRSAIYLFYLTLVYEIIGQIMKWWIFPSDQMIGWISFVRISFPLEELFFWIIISSLTIITLFEDFEEGVTNIKT